MKIFKSDWLSGFGQTFILVALENGELEQKMAEVVTISFRPDTKANEIKRRLEPLEVSGGEFGNEAIMSLVKMEQKFVRNQIESKNKLEADSLAGLIKFTETTLGALMFAFSNYGRAGDLDKALSHSTALSEVFYANPPGNWIAMKTAMDNKFSDDKRGLEMAK